METLLESLDRRVARRGADAWRRYAELLALGESAPESAADELASLMGELSLAPDQVKAHVAARREIEQLAVHASRRTELADAARAATFDVHAMVNRAREEIRRLEQEESQARGRQQQAVRDVEDANEAAARLATMRTNFAWMFRGADGSPVFPPVHVAAEGLPAALDPRGRGLEPDSVYSAEELASDFGVQAAWLEASKVTPMPGEGRRYFGAGVMSWLRAASLLIRDRSRAELRGRVVPVDPRLLELDPDKLYDVASLRALGLPVDRFRVGQEWTPAFGGDSRLGRDVTEWARRTIERNAALEAKLAEMDAEEAPPAEIPVPTVDGTVESATTEQDPDPVGDAPAPRRTRRR